MANFWDLPKPVRDKIYRLHLVREDPIDPEDIEDIVSSRHGMPRLLQLCRRTEREAAGIYFSENTFILDYDLPQRISPRHHKLVRRIVAHCWVDSHSYGSGYDELFRKLDRFKKVDLLTVNVDERLALEKHLARSSTIKWHSSLGCGPQLQLQTLHFAGIWALKSLRNISNVEFPPLTQRGRDRHGDSGAIPGGVLDTVIRRETGRLARPFRRKGKFDFLNLPPEIRNIVYRLLLVFPGVTYPKADKPTSVTSQFRYLRGVDRDDLPVPHSALAILQTSRQIHNEASSIFYEQNNLVFSFPAHLQAFALNLEAPRLESITNLTLFYECHKEGGVHIMDVTLEFLRRMRGLKKFHLLAERHMTKNNRRNSTRMITNSLSTIHGVAALFSLRGIADIKVRDLDLEDRVLGAGYYATHPADKASTKNLAQVLKHFNQGLALAQKGKVVQKLYKHHTWFNNTCWPKLGNAKCGKLMGCSCGDSEEQAQDSKGADDDE